MTVAALQERIIDNLRCGGGKKYEDMPHKEIMALTLPMAEAAQEMTEQLIMQGVFYKIAESEAVREQLLYFTL